jgi:hypothetical protein
MGAPSDAGFGQELKAIGKQGQDVDSHAQPLMND